MQPDKIHITTTRPLEPALIEQAASVNIRIDLLPLISTEPVQNEALKNRITQLAALDGAVAFTSLNAAKAVAALLPAAPAGWKIFTIGTATKAFVGRHFGSGSIAAVAGTASELAEAILPTGIRQLTYFCGDKRRDELPDKLQEAGVELEEVVVYKTVYSSLKATGPCDGILFFSPGAADAFFAVNPLLPGTVVFAIGATTAGAVRRHTANPVVVSEVPSAEALLEKVIAYFIKYVA